MNGVHLFFEVSKHIAIAAVGFMTVFLAIVIAVQNINARTKELEEGEEEENHDKKEKHK